MRRLLSCAKAAPSPLRSVDSQCRAPQACRSLPPRAAGRTAAAEKERELAVSGGDGGSAARDRTVAALLRVPAAQRAALVLRYLDGLSVPDVARTLGRSVESVESLLVRGRQSFKRAYQEVDA